MSKTIPNEFRWDDSFDSTCGSLVEGLIQEDFSTARARIESKTDPHYHKESKELYIVLKGRGKLRSRDLEVENDEFKEYDIFPGKEVLIKPNTVHQTVPETDVVVVETVNFPPWDEEDEYTVEESLF